MCWGLPTEIARNWTSWGDRQGGWQQARVGPERAARRRWAACLMRHGSRRVGTTRAAGSVGGERKKGLSAAHSQAERSRLEMWGDQGMMDGLFHLCPDFWAVLVNSRLLTNSLLNISSKGLCQRWDSLPCHINSQIWGFKLTHQPLINSYQNLVIRELIAVPAITSEINTGSAIPIHSPYWKGKKVRGCRKETHVFREDILGKEGGKTRTNINNTEESSLVGILGKLR